MERKYNKEIGLVAKRKPYGNQGSTGNSSEGKGSGLFVDNGPVSTNQSSLSGTFERGDSQAEPDPRKASVEEYSAIRTREKNAFIDKQINELKKKYGERFTDSKYYQLGLSAWEEKASNDQIAKDAKR